MRLLERLDVLKPLLRALGQTTENHALQVGRHIGRQARWPDDLIADVGDDYFHRICAVKGRAAGEQRIGNGAEGVNVAACVETVEAARACSGDM